MGWGGNSLPGEPSSLQLAFDPDAEHADYLTGAAPEPAVADSGDGELSVEDVLSEFGFDEAVEDYTGLDDDLDATL